MLPNIKPEIAVSVPRVIICWRRTFILVVVSPSRSWNNDLLLKSPNTSSALNGLFSARFYSNRNRKGKRSYGVTPSLWHLPHFAQKAKHTSHVNVPDGIHGVEIGIRKLGEEWRTESAHYKSITKENTLHLVLAPPRGMRIIVKPRLG